VRSRIGADEEGDVRLRTSQDTGFDFMRLGSKRE
jgi:hypothetical protein